VYVSYAPPSGLYRVKVPEGWARTDISGGASFTDKLNTVRVTTVPAAVAPTPASATSREAPVIAKASAHYQAGSVTTVSRTAGAAVLITYLTDSAPDPVTTKVVRDSVQRYEFWHNGTEAVLTLTGPVTADNVDPWRIITNSLQWR
jgi:hypothetical protein